MTSDEQYQQQVELVLTAQYNRVNSKIEHTPQACTCDFCSLERELRQHLQAMPQHVREQKNFVYLALEYLGRI